MNGKGVSPFWVSILVPVALLATHVDWICGVEMN